MFCRILNRLFTVIPADDCRSEYTAVVVDLAGNMRAIGTYPTEEEAERAAALEQAAMVDEHFGVNADCNNS